MVFTTDTWSRTAAGGNNCAERALLGHDDAHGGIATRIGRDGGRRTVTATATWTAHWRVPEARTPLPRRLGLQRRKPEIQSR